MQIGTASVLSDLDSGFSGRVIRPGDAEYDAARRIWNGDIDRHPAVIAQCLDATDVSKAVRAVVKSGLPLAVRSGGHSFPGLSVADGAAVIDLRNLREVRPSADDGFRAQGGCLLGDLDRAAAALGRAIPAGVVSHTGIAGLTLGGGYGYLSRRWGLTCDNLRSVELVTAEGEIRRVTRESDPELMWGLSGGGGNFGIVTEFEYESHPLPGVFAGWVLHPFDRATDFVDFFRDFAATMPRELATLLRLKVQGNTPFLAPELQGDDKTYIGVLAVWNGDQASGEEALRPLRTWGNPVHDDIRMQPYPDVQSGLDGGAKHGVGRYERAGYLRGIPAAAIEATLPRVADCPSAECEVSIFSLGGAIGDVSDEDSAYSNRTADHAFEVRSSWHDPAERSGLVDWTRATWTGIDEHALTGVYVNLVMDEGGDRVRRLYGEAKYGRLQRLKARMDPQNVFRLNQNITPAEPVGSGAA
jgi:FAD/FMN-containing dehydrogenase